MMIQWMCGMKLEDRKSSEELRTKYGLLNVCNVMRSMRIRWFGHVERAPEDSWINRCHFLEVEGNASRGRPRKTWQEVVNRDIRDLGVNKDLAQDCIAWKSAIKMWHPHPS